MTDPNKGAKMFVKITDTTTNQNYCVFRRESCHDKADRDAYDALLKHPEKNSIQVGEVRAELAPYAKWDMVAVKQFNQLVKGMKGLIK